METNEKLLSAISNVARLIKKEIHLSHCMADLTYAEVEILKFLQGKKKTAMKTIAVYLHIKPSSVTPIIDNLIKKDNIKRVQEKNDRRIIYIELTKKGADSLKKKHKNINKTIKNIFKKLNKKDKNELIKIFEKIHAKNT